MVEKFEPCILETPYAGDIEGNMKYTQMCAHDMILRKESPYASHMILTQPNVLDDNIPEERLAGIEAGFAWKHMQDVKTVFYTDRGISSGMEKALKYCEEHNMLYELRTLPNYKAQESI